MRLIPPLNPFRMRALGFLLLAIAGHGLTRPQHVVYGFVTDAVTGDTLPGVAYGLNYVQPGDTLEESRAQVTDSMGIYAVLLAPPESGQPDSNPVVGQPQTRPEKIRHLEFRDGRLSLILGKRERIEITVHSISGAKIGSFAADWPAGMHDLPVLVRNAGIHLYRIRAGNRTSVHKLLSLPGGKLGPGRLVKDASRPVARTAKPDLRGFAVYFAKRGYRSKKVPIQDTGWMDVSLQPMNLADGVKPGAWDLASDQGKNLLLHVADGGKSIDSIRLNVSRCFAGEAESSLRIPGPIAIPADGAVTIRGITAEDTLDIQFSDTSAAATFTQQARCRVRFNTARFPIAIDSSVGKVMKNPNLPFYIPGQYVSLSAAPKDSLTGFRYWSGIPYSPKTNPIWITSDAPLSIKANFAPNFILTLPEGPGKLSRDPMRLAYDPGDTVTVWASPDSGWRLRGWTGPILSSVHSQAKVVMDASKTIAPVLQAVHRLDVYTYRGWWECVPACEYDRVPDAVEGGRNIAYSPAEANAIIKVVAHGDSGFKVGRWSGDTLRTAKDTAWISMDKSNSVWATMVLKNLVKQYGAAFAGAWDPFAVSPDGKTLGLSMRDSILLWDMDLDARIRTIPNRSTRDMEFTADGTRLIACNILDYGLVFDIATGAELFLLARKARALAISPDQTSVAFLGDSVWMYDPATRAGTAVYPRLWPSSNSLGDLVFSSDGSKLAYNVKNAGNSDSISILDSKTGVAIRQFAADGDFPFVFSPDGTRLLAISGRFGDSLAVYDIATGGASRMHLMAGLREAAFSPDGKLLVASGSSLENGKVIDLASMQVIYRFPPSSGGVDYLAFTADSRRILAGMGGGNVTLWDFK